MATLGIFAIIFDAQRRVLCVRTSYGHQRWATPGGRIETGESPLEALPQPMTLIARSRILDGLHNKRGLYRVFETPATGNGLPPTSPDNAATQQL
jgi:hypothetical protein